ncbi:amino acid permease (plasmid) [Cupriavidus basilensis]
MSSVAANEPALKRNLKSRHIQLIALGGTIGTGLFLGSAGVLELAGPAMILGYAVGGLFAFLLMRYLGEMLVEEPVAGSFSHFAHKYWGGFAGFLAGWNCVLLYVLVGMLELTAAGKFIQYWWPEIPTWVTAAFFFILINASNFTSVKLYGEMEFWFALIKIAAVGGMIALGSYLLVTGKGGEHASVSNLWAHGGFFSRGVSGLAMAMAFIMFSFGGLEMLGFTAAEAENPTKIIPKAINQVIFRVLVFYIGSMAVLLSLSPWPQLLASLKVGGDTYSNSPFVMIFSAMGDQLAASVLNFIILTAALSVYNGMVYCNSRLLFGMAEQGDAPKFLAKANKRGIPVWAIVLPGALTGLCVVLNYVMPVGVIELLMSSIVASLIISWAMISVTHLRFRKAMRKTGVHPRFKAVLSPLTNYATLLFIASIVVVMYLTPGMRISVYAMPVLVGLLFLAYRSVQRRAATVGWYWHGC